MSIKELAFKLEDMEFKVEIICRTALAVHNAMTESSSAPETYFTALYGIVDSMFNLDEEFKKLVDVAFEIMRAEKSDAKKGEK